MVRVESEAIREIAFDSATQTLTVRFADGDWYSYFEVPEQIHRDFLRAESHGAFFQEYVRDAYDYRKGRMVDGEWVRTGRGFKR